MLLCTERLLCQHKKIKKFANALKVCLESVMDNQTKDAFVEAIQGENKSRDYRILEYKSLYPEKEYSELINDLALDITEERVCQILKNNRHLVLKLFAKVNPLYFKEGRAMEWVALYNAKDASKEDKMYALEGLRKLLEGDSKSIGEMITNKDKEDVTLKRNDFELQQRVRADLKANGVR